MDMKLLIIPAVLVGVAVGYMIFMNRMMRKRRKQTSDKSQMKIKQYVENLIPVLAGEPYHFLTALNMGIAEERDILVVIYIGKDLYLIPSTLDLVKQTLKQAESSEHYFGFKSTYKGVEYIPASEIETVKVSENLKKFELKFKNAQGALKIMVGRQDVFGWDQSAEVEAFAKFCRDHV